MIANGWWVWIALMTVFVVGPVSYGWGYRGWGPPLPRYIQRQRMEDGAPFAGRAPHHHRSWGVMGDGVWIALTIGAIGSLGALFGR